MKRSTTNNCLSCALYVKCKDPSKGFSHICSKFTAQKSVLTLEQLSHKTSIKKLAKLDKGYKSQSTRTVTRSPIVEIRATKEKYKVTDSEDYDIASLVRKLNNASLVIPKDTVIDDGDLKLAPNFYTFMTHKKYMNYRPFAKQIETGMWLFTEFCPECSDMQFAGDLPTDMPVEDIPEYIVMLKHGKCPECGLTKLDIWKSGLLHRYEELAGLGGQRGGKSAQVAMLAAYQTHRMLKLQNPARVYELLPNQTLHLTFVALTFKQAKDNLYQPLHDMVIDSPWFSEYHKLLGDYEKRLGIENLFKFKDTFFHYLHRKLQGYPSGPNRKTLRGYTRYFGAIDEIGWFDAHSPDAVRMSAEENYISLKRSLLTVRSAARRLHYQGHYALPQALMTNISSPASKRDKICSLVKESENNHTIYSFHYTTFEMNPTIQPEDLEGERKADPIAYARDYLARPPYTSNAFIARKKPLQKCIEPHKPILKVYEEPIVTHSDVELLSGKVKFSKAFLADKNLVNHPRILALDSGYSNNSFAGTLLSIRELDNGAVMPTVDAFFELIPKENRPLSYSDIYDEVLSPIIDKANVQLLTADRWNTIKILQDAEADYGERGMRTIMYTLKYGEFVQVRSTIMEGAVALYAPEIPIKDAIKLAGGGNYPECFKHMPCAHFFMQALTVVDVMKKKVDKADGLTDDIFRSYVLALTMAMDVNLQREFAQWQPIRTGAPKQRDMGVVVSLGAGASSGATSTNIGAVGSAGSGVTGGGNVFSRG